MYLSTTGATWVKTVKPTSIIPAESLIPIGMQLIVDLNTKTILMMPLRVLEDVILTMSPSSS